MFSGTSSARTKRDSRFTRSANSALLTCEINRYHYKNGITYWPLDGGFVKVKTLAILIASAPVFTLAQASQISKLDRERAQPMLRRVIDEVRKNYYDPRKPQEPRNSRWAGQCGESIRSFQSPFFLAPSPP